MSFATLCLAATIVSSLAVAGQAEERSVRVDSRRELFLDYHLIDKLDGARLVLQRPKDEGVVFKFDQPWEGLWAGCATVIKDGDSYRLYYRGVPKSADLSELEVTCVAYSDDGVDWTRPTLGRFEVQGTRENNVILHGPPPFSHNFSPFLDTRPGVPASERYKATAGHSRWGGLFVFVSGDGLQWRKMSAQPAIPLPGAFDSQNVAFWSESEGNYVCYFRTWTDEVRRVSRALSKDFVNWSEPVRMEYRCGSVPAPLEQIYTNQTHPYFRAPHIYIALAMRFLPGRQVISVEEARALKVEPRLVNDCSDGVLMSTRGGAFYDRTFMEGFIRPGIGAEHWTSEANFPALGVVPTGKNEMSLYGNCNAGQPAACLHRYSLRLDGFASVQAPHRGGQMLTKPLVFAGKELLLNFATSAAGDIRTEIQDALGQPIQGYTLEDAVASMGNRIEQAARWKSGSDVSRLADKPVRLRFVMKDADLYAIQFQ